MYNLKQMYIVLNSHTTSTRQDKCNTMMVEVSSISGNKGKVRNRECVVWVKESYLYNTICEIIFET